jgi:uncharacterized protein YndB with AHSA1/START domain
MIRPVIKDVRVPVAPAAAFQRFTVEIGLWWPRATHSLGQTECADVRMEPWVGGRLYEVGTDGVEQEWGRLTEFAEPRRVSFTWYVGRSPDTAQHVIVDFHGEEDGTHVHVEHHGWEKLGEEGAKMRDGYDQGWTPVLDSYVQSLSLAAR